MKIPNPWRHYPMARCTCKPGDVVCTLSTREDFEVPDGTVEVMIEPVANGRPDAPAIAQGKIWSKRFGMQDLEDHLKKADLEREEAEAKVRREAEARKRQEEAKDRERAEKQRVEMEDKAKAEAEAKAKTEAEAKAKAEPAPPASKAGEFTDKVVKGIASKPDPKK